MGAPFVAGLAETDVAPTAPVSPPAAGDEPRQRRPDHVAPSVPGDPGRNPGGRAGRRRSGARGPGWAARARMPIAAARREVERLRKAGAEIVIALAPIERTVARRLAREAQPRLRRAGAAGRQGAPAGRGGRHGRYLVAPGRRAAAGGTPRHRRCARAAAPLVDAGSPEELGGAPGRARQAVARLDADLKQWTTAGRRRSRRSSRPSARERDKLEAERKALAERLAGRRPAATSRTA